MEPEQSVAALLKNLNRTLQAVALPRQNSGEDQPDAFPFKRERIGSISSRPSTLRNGKVHVLIRVVFVKIGDIDTVKECFQADAFVQAKWREPKLDGKHKNTEFELLEHGDMWNPMLFVENIAHDVKESVWYMVSYNDLGEATVYQRRRIKGVFNETMELEQYPFDTQDLTMTISTECNEEELCLVEDESELSSVSVQSFVDEQEWHLHRHVTSKQRDTTNAYKNTRHKHPALAVSIKASRRNGFFVWNIVLIMFLICSLVFTTFTVAVDKPQNRLQLSFILLLSNITFKMAVSSTTPKVSYLTYLDKYILASMVILCMVCVWHAIVSELYYFLGEDVAKLADKIGFAVLISTYIIFNVIYFAVIKFMVYKKCQEYERRDLHQKDKLKAMDYKASQVSPV